MIVPQLSSLFSKKQMYLYVPKSSTHEIHCSFTAPSSDDFPPDWQGS